MKIYNLFILFIISELLFRNPIFAQWIQTNGPYGGNIHSIAVLGKNIFAGSYGGCVYLSTDNGANWTQVNEGLTNTNVSALVVSGTNLLAGTSGGVGCIFTGCDQGVL